MVRRLIVAGLFAAVSAEKIAEKAAVENTELAKEMEVVAALNKEAVPAGKLASAQAAQKATVAEKVTSAPVVAAARALAEKVPVVEKKAAPVVEKSAEKKATDAKVVLAEAPVEVHGIVQEYDSNGNPIPIDPSEYTPEPEEGSTLWFFRWLWWPLIAYMFFAQAVVCDDWFVPSIEVVAEKYNIPEDVAGATLMALGCNGPELFTNVIALFITHSDVGVGTIVGSEIFNLLLIVGGSILATPLLPLKVDKIPFIRDCGFYFLSIVLLLAVLWDGRVTFLESFMLCCCAGLFGTAVGLTDRFCKFMGYRVEEADKEIANPVSFVIPYPGSSIETPGVHTTVHESRPRSISGMTDALSTNEVDVRVIRHNRMADTHSAKHTVHSMVITSRGFEIAGLDFKPCSEDAGKLGSGTPRMKESLLRHDTLPTLVEVPKDLEHGDKKLSHDGHTAAICWSDILHLSDQGGSHLTVDCRGTWGEKISLEMTLGNEADKDFIIKSVNPNKVYTPRKSNLAASPDTPTHSTSFLGLEHTTMSIREGSALTEIAHAAVQDVAVDLKDENVGIWQKLGGIAGVPINFCLESTMHWADPKDGSKKQHWFFAFCISMCWLALFSYVMVVSADYINVEFGITQAVLGVTLCAAGTSFPNLWASLLTAKDGKSAMAIANALGSNVQNVFIALAFPWIFKTAFAPGQYIVMATPGIMDGVAWMAGTWALLVSITVCGNYSLGTKTGYLFFGLYAVYLVDACFIHNK